ncbi:heme ABC transporter ATP-binding protein [Lacimicrobium alkaliphilum]|uniref:Hemin import ATP-binding protein HmuV n=1 Tax=Lacimicrobium alkaliphilum TaxID=1526571 RepID=A0ABQ1R667_9ALTE|nr:heme ABC transporter ATP-binding protein [Lacimicrobium alkaliphilum]GGD59529.1 hemin import ATP-binding protein HmuV [Lacimicrobium alkaliphilum]
MLNLYDLSICRGGRKVIEDLSIELFSGQMVAILGENGAGKSTLIRAIAGDLAFSGHIQLQGRSLHKWSAAQLASVRAVMEQQFSPPPLMAVQELVALGRYIYRESDARTQQLVRKWLVHTQLQEFAHREVMSLSGGEQQRVQLARCLAQLDNAQPEPSVLLLDEPTSALDLYHQHQCLQQVRHFAQQGNLVIAVMHDVNLASLYADHILLLKQGRLIAQGSAQQVLQSSTLESVYQINMHISPHPTLEVPMVFSALG